MENDKEAIQDEVLVVAAILGDLQAFDELVRRYRQPVIRLATSIAGQADADDIAQDAWLLAFKSLPGIDNPEKFASWLMVITRHRALRHRQKTRVQRARQMPMDVYLLEQFSAITMPAVQSDEDERISLALDALPADYSMVMKMRFFDAIPLKKIASFLDVPLSTVKWRIYKGKALLLEEIKRLDKADEAWRNR
ncbi:MAG: sigma-70 family RNA polymerase sigma factor [Bacteroidota bacterium]